jgi:dTDP-4-dehydrorhamnose reductase
VAPTVVVTGASGLLGRRVVAVALDDGWQVIAPTHDALDVRDRGRFVDVVTRAGADAVVHLAYRVDEVDTIVDGSRHAAEAAAAVGARLVHLSTDVVFGGRADPYTESDPPDPVSDYGRAKARAEADVQAAGGDAVIVRTSLLYSADPIALAPCQRDVLDPAFTFFTDEWRSPACADDVAAAVVALAGRHPGVRGVLHVAGPEAWTRAGFAQAVASWVGQDPTGVRTAARAELGLVRPGRVVLDPSRAESMSLRCRPVTEVLRPRSS